MLFEGLYGGFFYATVIRLLPIFMLYLFPVILCMKGRKIYKLTFLIYAIHQPIIIDFVVYIRGFILKITPYAFICNLGARIIFLGIDFILASVIYIIFKKYVPKVLGVLTGGRI